MKYLKKLLRTYRMRESINNHNGAALLLVENFGTQEEIDTIKAIQAKHKKQGFMEASDIDLRIETSQKYYKLLFTAK